MKMFPRTRTAAPAAVTAALIALLALLGLIVAAAVPQYAGAKRRLLRPVSVLTGRSYYRRIAPDDYFTLRDRRQATGRRVAFRMGRDYPLYLGRVRRRCTAADYSICDSFAELSHLDGFDLQPRVTIPFSGAIDLSSVNDRDVFITDASGAVASHLRQITFDPATHTMAGIADTFLKEGARYRIHVTSGIRDTRGRRVRACSARAGCVVTFTTRTASAILSHIRMALDLPLQDTANAYALAGFPGASTSTASRKLTFTQDGTPDVFAAASVGPSLVGSSGGIMRSDQIKADAAAPGALRQSVVPNLIPPGTAGYFAFGSYLSPRYQYASANGHQDDPYGIHGGLTDGEIPPLPTRSTPRPFGADRLGVIAVTPNPQAFPPPWPVAVYGPGFTRSDFDIFVSADYNASRGILTIATDPAGHGYGPKSTVTVTTPAGAMTFLSYGRGRDLYGKGTIDDGLNAGVGPTGHVQPDGSALPSRKPLDGLQSGLMQTVVDNMALGRAVAAGLDIPGVGTNVADPTRIYYYGISFGGIYGTMLMGTDPLFRRGLLNVPGGPIADIARLSAFRGDLADQLARARPKMLNGGPGLKGFTEDLPLPEEPSRTITHPGAAALQELLGASDWYDRSGSPETFAPRIRLRPDPAWASRPKEIAFQTAYGDGTVPNPTASTLYRAGKLFDRVVLYRNDKTPTYSSDPHGWLADPTLAGRTFGQQQLGEFLATGQLTNPNPQFLETPISDPVLLTCLHYPDPQSGQDQARQPYPQSVGCPAPAFP